MIRVTGFDEFEENLKKFADNLERKTQEASGEVPLLELLPDTFMQRHTQFQSLQAMLNAAGIEDPEEIKGEAWSMFVGKHSNFANWEEMLSVAGTEYMRRKLTE